MSLHDDAMLLHASFQTKASNAHSQGRSPTDVPLTLQEGLSISALLVALSTRYENHHHDITINNKDRETTGPL